MDVVNEYLKKHFNGKFIPEWGMWTACVTSGVTCKDGFNISIQASECHYCTPRETAAWPYSEVELGFPNEEDDLIKEYAEDDDYCNTVYGYVPIEIVVKLIEKHGGIVEQY